MVKKYTAIALVLMTLVIGAYVTQFYLLLGYELSEKASDWVDFSDFVGGLLGPILSFLSLVLLLHSLNLQNEANRELKKESQMNLKSEKFRTFETHFFNLLDAQRSAFENFKTELYSDQKLTRYDGVDGVIKLEDFIDDVRDAGFSDADITEELDDIDCSERIYNTIRIFYNITKMISEKLSDEKGFSVEDRKNQYQTLINFTEFSQLRLVLISMQFIDCPPSHHLNNNDEFLEILIELGADINPY